LPSKRRVPRPNDLLELDHGVDGTHEDDVADVSGIDSGGEFLGGSEDGGDSFLVILKGLEVLFAEFAIVGGDADAVVGFCADLYLVDQVTDGEGVGLAGAKYQGLFGLVDGFHEDLHPVAFAFFNLNDAVEI
jgi:hypothetical protein